MQIVTQKSCIKVRWCRNAYLSGVDWFGKKEANKVLDGAGTWLDEQQLTKEEQVKYKLALFEKMAPFKIVQRIIVSIVFSTWAFLIVMSVLAVWVAHFTGNRAAMEGLAALITSEFVWGPTLAASALYLGGGLDFFKRGKK